MSRPDSNSTVTAPSAAGRARGLELVELGFIIALYGWLVVRLVGDYLATGNVVNLLLLASEGLVVAYILVRRPASELSAHPSDWLLAVSATLLPLLVRPAHDSGLVPMQYASLLMLAGLFFQIAGKVALGRSFGCVPAHRGLIVRGPYRFVRHPIYAGYLATHVAFLLAHPTLWNLGVYVFAYLLQIPRLLAEERLLSSDPRYREYMASVRYRLLPGVY